MKPRFLWLYLWLPALLLVHDSAVGAKAKYILNRIRWKVASTLSTQAA